jgi:uncharacterized protein YjbI with pentapeptide repeats
LHRLGPSDVGNPDSSLWTWAPRPDHTVQPHPGVWDLSEIPRLRPALIEQNEESLLLGHFRDRDLENISAVGALAEVQWRIDALTASLRGAQLQQAHLNSASLSGVDFSFADMQRVQLQGAKLQGAHFNHALMQAARLSHADLTGAELVESDLDGASLEGAALYRSNLTRASLRGSLLSEQDSTGLRSTTYSWWARI